MDTLRRLAAQHAPHADHGVARRMAMRAPVVVSMSAKKSKKQPLV